MKSLLSLIVAAGIVLGFPRASFPIANGSSCTEPTAATVWLVKTGGFWRSAGRFGHYRVIVRREGVEHAIDRAELQILETNDKTGKREVATCTDLKTPGLKGYVEDIVFRKVSDAVTAISLDISMKAMDEVVLREVILASRLGKIQRVVDATSTDLQEMADRLGSQ
jgi:hypothetical protein